MIGVGLDSINKPDKNLIKVSVMAFANIIGDLIAVFIFKSLLAVAVASIAFTLIGIWIGFIYLNKELNINYLRIFSSGFDFYLDMYNKLKKRKH